MKTQQYFWQLGKLLGLTLLIASLGLVWMATAALAEGPEVVVTVEPVTPTPSPTTDPGEIGLIINPPSASELGEPVKNETPQNDAQDTAGGPIDIFDLSFVASRYGSNNPAADLNFDGAVDIFDLTMLASHYGQTVPEADAAAIPTPAPLPLVEVNSKFGGFNLPVEGQTEGIEAQASQSRGLRIGVSINYVKLYDYMDGQTNTPPDPYAVVSVGGVPARTATVWNQYESWPNWRLGWWRYASFPWASNAASQTYSLPISLEMRDDDGSICYGYYGCRPQSEAIDVSPVVGRWTKGLTVYPANCMVVDEAGTRTYGTWLDSNRCRVYLQSAGNEWGRGYISYYIDALWD
jgi:hypothetical protein